MAKILNLFPDWWRSLNQEKGKFECLEREGDLKDTQRNTQNAALNVNLFQNIFSFREINLTIYTFYTYCNKMKMLNFECK